MAGPIKRPRGRPPLPEGERRSYQLHVPLSHEEHADLIAWAEGLGEPLTVAVRRVLGLSARRAARRAG